MPSATVKVTLKIKMKEVDKNVRAVDISRSEFRRLVKDELYQAAEGFANGQGNYRFDDWKEIFFAKLVEYNEEIEWKENAYYK